MHTVSPANNEKETSGPGRIQTYDQWIISPQLPLHRKARVFLAFTELACLSIKVLVENEQF